MGYQGPLFTWCNKREEGVICKKLDRVFMNEEAIQRFPNAYSVFEGGGCSDHVRCKVQILPPLEKIKKPFKYICECNGELGGFYSNGEGVLGINTKTLSFHFCHVQVFTKAEESKTAD